MQNEFASDLTPKERREARLITEAAILRSNMWAAGQERRNKDYKAMRHELRKVEAELRAVQLISYL